MKDTKKILGILRILLGFIFFWAFLDKTFGLGFATQTGKAWINGVSPTYGFLKFGAHGIFEQIFRSMAGNSFVDILFMLGLLGIGVALILGIGMRIATITGSLLVFLLWMAEFPPKQNPLIDEHVIYLFLFLLFWREGAGDYVGLGKWWKKTPLVKTYPLLT